MSTREATCAERIASEMQAREEQLEALYNDPETSSEDDPALSVDTKQITTICLSYGGPADYLEVTHSKYGIEKVIYRFSDWFDTATREVEEGSALYRYAELIIEMEGN